MTPFFARLIDRTWPSRSLGGGILALVMSLGLPIQAAAQFTLTGQFVEQIPGGGTSNLFNLELRRVSFDGSTDSLAYVQSCNGGATTNCVQPDGSFNVLDLPTGLYLLRFWNNSILNRYVAELFNVSINGNADVGVVPVVRAPFNLEVTMGQIPSSGGPIPLTVRAQTRWDIPTLPVTVRFRLRQVDVDLVAGEGDVELPTKIDFTWPAGLADSGVVALPPINVRASAPAGARSCVDVRIALRDQPDVLLGAAEACQGKQP